MYLTPGDFQVLLDRIRGCMREGMATLVMIILQAIINERGINEHERKLSINPELAPHELVFKQATTNSEQLSAVDLWRMGRLKLRPWCANEADVFILSCAR